MRLSITARETYVGSLYNYYNIMGMYRYVFLFFVSRGSIVAAAAEIDRPRVWHYYRNIRGSIMDDRHTTHDSDIPISGIIVGTSIFLFHVHIVLCYYSALSSPYRGRYDDDSFYRYLVHRTRGRISFRRPPQYMKPHTIYNYYDSRAEAIIYTIVILLWIHSNNNDFIIK